MPLISRDPDQLLTQLEAAKNQIDPNHSTRVSKLLDRLSRLALTDPCHVIRLHECLLFLRAFPHSPSLIPRVEKLLNSFHERIETLRSANSDLSVFDDFDTSGIAGTTMQDTLSFDVARWLVRRIPRYVEIAWNDYWEDCPSERARGTVWPRFIPLLEEDADVEANIPWQRWLDSARGRENPLPWLIRRFEQLPLPSSQRAELHDSLRLPIRWHLDNLKLSRTRNFTRPRQFFFHTAPFIQRSEVSLARELAQPAPKLKKLALATGQSVMDAIRDVMVVRYRELYGTTLGDPRTVVRADLGRGVVMYFWELPPDRRLPLRAYLAGYTLKNGVPINYIEAIGLCDWIEVGFNTFYTYRQGETAWIYAQALRCLRAFTGATTISVYPYQIGQNNDEAIDSGAFWFYRKLGFRSGRKDLEELARREEKKIAANPRYRTPKRTLKRLAEAHMFYDSRRSADLVSGTGSTGEERPFQGRADGPLKEKGFSSDIDKPGPWDTFSTRHLGLLINRRMAREFDGDNERIRQASAAQVSRTLNISLSRWNAAERLAFENWSLVLALLPGLSRWSPQEKQDAVRIIRTQAGGSEMHYLRLTQQHRRLRAELLRLGK